MIKARQILCIDPEPPELRIGALLNHRGIGADVTEASTPAALREALARPAWWDLILCDATSFGDRGLEDRLAVVKAALDASLILLTRENEQPPKAWYHRGAADLVRRSDMDHLLMACERELEMATLRRELRLLREARGIVRSESAHPLMLATINDLGKASRAPSLAPPAEERSPTRDEVLVSAEARIKSLIESGGLMLEYQPIISFQPRDERRGMFEALVRLKDETGQVLLPESFLPILEHSGWMGKVDLWIVRRAVAMLEQIQRSGSPEVVLFVNIATSTLQSDRLVAAIGTFAAAAKISPGSLIIEVSKAAFDQAPERLARLAERLDSQHHGLLMADVGLSDCELIARHCDRIKHLKLDRVVAQELAAGRVSPPALTDLVQCARREGIRVIALAVESANLLSTLVAAGVDAIQGHFVSLPYSELVYPTVQSVEAPTAPQWRAPGK